MNKVLTIVMATMLIGGTAYAGVDVIAPPVTKYVEVPLPPKRPTNFGKIDNKKVAKQIEEVTSKKN